MLAVMFYIGEDRYILEATRIVEILPLARLKALPRAPQGLVGMLNHQGHPLPVVDLTWVAQGTPAPTRFGTRIIVVELGPDQPVSRVGLLVERVFETVRVPDRRDAGAPVVEGAPWLGPVISTTDGLVQRVNPEGVLSPDIQAAICAWLEDEGSR